MLKFNLENLDGLSPEQQSLYEKVGDQYRLKVEGMPNADSQELEKLRKEKAALTSKNEELLGEKKREQEEKRKAESEAQKAAAEAAAKKGDIESLTKSFQEQLAAKQTELDELNQSISQSTIKAEAMRLAATISEGANQELLADFMGRQLRVDDGKVVVTTETGEATVSTPDDLVNQFKTNPKFASLITASKASGTGGSGQPASTDGKKFSDFSPGELARMRKESPEKYDQILKTKEG